MSDTRSAAELEIQNRYSFDELMVINDEGCAYGAAEDHLLLAQTGKFFDKYEDQMVNYLKQYCGEESANEYLEEIKNNNQNDTKSASYKNDLVWFFIELLAGDLVS